MDLNRPFGDGRDNNGDGVVDDPLEAGEPFLDKMETASSMTTMIFIDLDGMALHGPEGSAVARA